MSADFAPGLLAALGRAVGIEALAWDAEGCCTLRFDAVVVNLEVDPVSEQLLLYSALGEIPAEGQAELFAHLLEANLFWQDTRGGTLALDRLGHRILLTEAVPLTLVPERFPDRVERFVETAEAWIEQLAQLQPTDAPVATPAAEPPICPTRFV